MRIRGDHLKHCAVFLGWKNESGFLAEGTGFFVSLETDGFVFAYVISAAHILWPNRKFGGESHEKIDIRVSRENGDPAVITTKSSEWLFHSDKSVDLCAYEFDIQRHSPSDELEIHRFDIESMVLSKDDLDNQVAWVGDEVAIIGAFVGRVGIKRNIPVFRIGNIAAMPEEPIDFGSPKFPAYLIETRSLGGISGSPVLINVVHLKISGDIPPSVHVKQGAGGGRTIPAPYKLLGMIIGAHGNNYFSDFISEGDTDIKSKDFEFNAGISIAIPSSAILDFLNQPDVQTAREVALDIRRKRSGFVQT